MTPRPTVPLLIVAALLAGWPGPVRGQDAKTDLANPDPTVSGLGKRASFLCDSGLADVYPCHNINLVAFLPKADLGAVPGIGLNDAWGWVDPQTGQRWALVGREDGTAFVELTDPASPRYAGELRMPLSAQSNVWRDIKVDGTWAFIVADGSANRQGMHGMQVFDLTRLRSANGSPVSFTADAHYTDFAVAHNVVVNEESDRAYAVGARLDQHGCNAGLHMIDIADPLDPQFIGCFADRGTGRAGLGYTHDAQCVTYRGPDREHQGREICVGSNETALSIVDVTEATAPRALARATYPAASYVHQGWFSEDQRLFIQNDELDERQFDARTHTYIWDVVDLDDPVLLTDFVSDVTSTDHNLYVRGDLVYQANYSSGLRVMDISDPEDPFVAGFFDTRPDDSAVNFNGAWTAWPYPDSDLVVISSRAEGLFVVRPSSVIGTRFTSLQATETDDMVRFDWQLNHADGLSSVEVIQHLPDGGTLVLHSASIVPASGSVSIPIKQGAYRFQMVAYSPDGGRVESEQQFVFVVHGAHFIEGPWPNPVSDAVQAKLMVSRTQHVRVSIHDALGRERTVLFDAQQAENRQLWFTQDVSDWPAGTYYLRMVGQHFQDSAPFTVVR